MPGKADALFFGTAIAVGSVVVWSAVSLLWRKYWDGRGQGKRGRIEDVDMKRRRRLDQLHHSSSSMDMDELAESLHSKSQHGAAAWNALGLEQPLVIATVGLPARGKSFISKMIIRYLKWTGFECEVFNVGSHRRKIGLQSADSSFFDMSNENAKQVRENMALSVQDDMYKWLHESTTKRRVAIFDATNTTKGRRLALAKRARSENVYLLFVESICDDQNVLRRNYELKLQNDDYKGMEPEKALADFIARVVAYEKVYETIEDGENDSNISYIKLINVGQKIITRNCSGYLPSQISFYLQNIHINPRKIFLCLTAETFREASQVVGGLGTVTGVHAPSIAASNNGAGADASERAKHSEKDSFTGLQHESAAQDVDNLNPEGKIFSLNVAKFVKSELESMKDAGKEILVLTGTSREQAETVSHLRLLYYVYCTPLLNELRGGDLHGMSKNEIKTQYPIEYEMRQRDKLHYRYPGSGESYLDVIERVRPIIIELERQRKSVIIVCHMAVLRCITSYFLNTDLKDVPFKEFKRHVVYELEVGPFGSVLKQHDALKLDI